MTVHLDNDKSPAPAVTRAVAILDVLAAAHGEPRALSDLAREVGIAKSSMSNLCTALEAARLIRRVDGGYQLGRKTVELGGAYLSSIDLIREFYQVCTADPILSRELVQIAVLDGTQVIYLARHEGRSPLRLSASIGDRFPASSTATGAALLANLEPAQVADRYRDQIQFVRMTDKAVGSLPELQAKLEATRRQGYGVDDEEVQQGVKCFAVAIPPRNHGAAEFAMGITVLTAALTEEREKELLDALFSAAKDLSSPMTPVTPVGAGG